MCRARNWEKERSGVPFAPQPRREGRSAERRQADAERLPPSGNDIDGQMIVANAGLMASSPPGVDSLSQEVHHAGEAAAPSRRLPVPDITIRILHVVRGEPDRNWKEQSWARFAVDAAPV